MGIFVHQIAHSMATSFTRICRPAVRSTTQQRSHSLSRRSFAERTQCPGTRASWTPPLQQRTSNRSFRSLAPVRQTDAFDEEKDAELHIAEDTWDDLPYEADMSSTAHAELEQHRELRKMARLAAWEMPLLSKLAVPFVPPDTKAFPLRWRFTTYLGDAHPQTNKVVVMFRLEDLEQLSEKEKMKLRKLCGSRYNPETETVRMSCESFESQLQNKRYLGDTIQKLLAEAQDPEADSFEDIPLDTRHHKFKKRYVFPEEWKLSPEKREALEERRKTLLLAEDKRVEENTVVSGVAAIEAARQFEQQPVEEPLMANARTLQRGRSAQRRGW